MSQDIPSFDIAQARLAALVASLGYPSRFHWAFRQDLFQPTADQVVARHPVPASNKAHAELVFEEGRGRGLVQLRVLYRLNDFIGVTVFAPGTDEIQGWNQGLKLSVDEPLPSARPVRPGLSWFFQRLRPSYRRYQARQESVHSAPDATG